MTAEWIDDPSMKIRRKRRMPPEMPEDPEDRFAEVQVLLTELVELVDYEHYDVYDSVFFQRTVQYMDGMSFRDVEALDDDNPRKAYGLQMRDLGREIVSKQTTSTRAFVRFFKSIVDFRES